MCLLFEIKKVQNWASNRASVNFWSNRPLGHAAYSSCASHSITLSCGKMYSAQCWNRLKYAKVDLVDSKPQTMLKKYDGCKQ